MFGKKCKCGWCLSENSKITLFIIIYKFKKINWIGTTFFLCWFWSVSESCFCFIRILDLGKKSAKSGSLLRGRLNIWNDLTFLKAWLWRKKVGINLHQNMDSGMLCYSLRGAAIFVSWQHFIAPALNWMPCLQAQGTRNAIRALYPKREQSLAALKQD